ncbi:MAG: hypothetical protein KDD22_08140, partial [Bdellovibrionales bacterium]|nr:hypothetical protein [Bdellovibrionales bacterium]
MLSVINLHEITSGDQSVAALAAYVINGELALLNLNITTQKYVEKGLDFLLSILGLASFALLIVNFGFYLEETQHYWVLWGFETIVILFIF